MKSHALLMVDDEPEILSALAMTFGEEYRVLTASSGAEAIGILEREPVALIIADQRMPGMTGVELLERSIGIDPDMIRIMITGYPEASAAIEAVNNGRVYAYFTKPWNHRDLQQCVRRALESYALTKENRRLVEELKRANARLTEENVSLRKEMDRDLPTSDIVADSPPMRRALNLVDRVIDNPVTVLLTGETGCGKTLLARHIHQQGPRRDKRFVEQNCGALPEALLESELFGHKRGAFTGAVQDQKGLFEAADGGTLFLDEISEMSPVLQVKLLQVLQEGRFRRVGENHYRQVDVRILAATNRDLEAEVREGRFRADLFYRINVFPIQIPPLRERREDIPGLARLCLARYGPELNRLVTGFTDAAVQGLCRYDFPGNVRELQNLVERALLLSTGTRIDLGDWLPSPAESSQELSKLDRLERAEILRLMEVHRGSASRVASELGISRTTLWRRLKQYGTEAHRWSPAPA